jgi:hypothetical protein
MTKEEAQAAVNPALSPDEKAESERRLLAGSAALDAYLNSRGPLEEITARAQGAGRVPTWHEINPHETVESDAEIVGETQVAAAPANAGELTAPVLSPQDEEKAKRLEAELAALRTRA